MGAIEATPPAKPPRWADRFVAVFAVFTVAYVAWALFGTGPARQQEIVSDLAPLALGLAMAFLAFRAAARPDADPATHRAWQRIGLAFLLWWAGDVLWFVEDVILHRQPFPSPADAGYLAFYPCLVWGLLSLRSAPRSRGDLSRVGLDTLTVLIAAAMGVWYLVVGPTVHGQPGQGLAAVLNVAYPVGDLVLLFGVMMLMLRPSGSEPALRVLLPGVCLFVVADLGYARLSLSGAYAAGDWPDALWVAAQFFMLLAGWVQLRRGPGKLAETPVPSGIRKVSSLPYLAVAGGHALLLAVGIHQGGYPLNGLLVGAVAITTVVMIRQVHVTGENVRLLAKLQELADTDPVTGLHNRRGFLDSAERLADRARLRSRPLSLLMVDVDHFKSINDTYGHAAGDKVLAEVAAAARTQLREDDLIGRYGGDELVVALPDCSAANALDVAERICGLVASRPVISAEGVVSVKLSIGVGHTEGAGTLTNLLARADAALYEAKRAGRGCVRAHTVDTVVVETGAAVLA